MKMEFVVSSGSHTKEIEANDFDHAANLFLKSLLKNERNLRLGGVISVSILARESFIETDNALKNLGNPQLILHM